MNSMKIFIIIFFILILFYIFFFIKKNYIETFSKNETVKLINEVKNSTINQNQLDKCIYSSNNLDDLEDITNIISNCNPEQDNIIHENSNYKNINQKKKILMKYLKIIFYLLIYQIYKQLQIIIEKTEKILHKII